MARRSQQSLQSDILSTTSRPILSDGSTFRNHIEQMIISRLLGKSNLTPQEIEIEQFRELARSGNPFPLIARQWPELVVTNPIEQPFFEGDPLNPLDPVLRLDHWQRRIIKAYFDDTISEIMIKGNTKAGKGASTSIAVNIWYDVFDESKVILTSQRFDHAIDVIFGEISMWRRKMQCPGPGKLTATGLAESKQHYITIANPQSGEGFSGQHGPRTLFVMDEATSSPDGFYNDAQKQARKIVALANPRTMTGWFRDAYKPCNNPDTTQVINAPFGRRLCVTVDGADNLNVRAKRLERPYGPPGGIQIDGEFFPQNTPIPPEYFARVMLLIPNQCDYGRFMGICQHADPRHVAVFAHGRFPTEDPDKQIILSSWLDFHRNAYDPLSPPAVEAFGLDIARSLDGDSTSLSAGGQTGLHSIHRWHYADVMFHVAEVLRIALTYGIDLRLGRHPVTVDMDGLGCGVGDRLRELGVWVIEFRGNASSKVDPRVYGNMRAEAYATLGRRLNPDDMWSGKPWAMPFDANLYEELCAPEKIIQGGDALRFILTPKKPNPDKPGMSVREKIGRSPDAADSVVYLFNSVRVLHNLNEWFANSTRELVIYPSPQSVAEQLAPKIHQSQPATQQPLPPDPSASNATDSPSQSIPDILRQLREMNGPLLDKPIDSTRLPPKPTIPLPANNTQSSTSDWTSRIKWSDDE